MTTIPNISASRQPQRGGRDVRDARNGCEAHVQAGVSRMGDQLAVTIRWTISPGALLAAEPARALLNGHAATLAGAVLQVCVDHAGRVSAELLLTMRSGESDSVPIELAPVQATLTRTDDAECLDAPGVLAVTLRRDGSNGPSLAYAHTPLLHSALALSGGVYDQPELAC